MVETVYLEYDNLLENHCNDLFVLEDRHKKYFTYGNAQKLVNMFMKNLYVISVISSLYNENKTENKWEKNFQLIESFFPIDSYILASAGKELENPPWSKIDKYEDYIDIKEDLEKADINFKNENERWIRQAKYTGLSNDISKIEKYLKLLNKNNTVQNQNKEIEVYIGKLKVRRESIRGNVKL